VIRRAPTPSGYRWEMRAPNEPLVRCEVERFVPGPGEVVVRVVGCGLCHTDLGFLFDGVRPRHDLPLALGHEISGEVVDAAQGLDRWIGRAVIVPAVTPCGDCEACRSGRGTICARQVMPGNDAHGGFASHVIVPARGLCPVHEAGALEGRPLGRAGVTLAELAVLADAVSTPYQAVRRSNLSRGDLAVVIGLGGVGGFAAQIARSRGATVVGIDVDPRRLESLSHHGVLLSIDPAGKDPREVRNAIARFAAAEHLPGHSWRIFECSGTKAGQELAWSLLVPDAHLSVIGFTRDKAELRLSSLMALDATARGNWGCLPELYPEALSLVLEGGVAVKPFVEVHPMDEIQAVVEDARRHRLGKRPVLALTAQEDPR
jgi:6-hydroxycyclohex-1-ene-1-carbonyl-CoA dehydrogenase